MLWLKDLLVKNKEIGPSLMMESGALDALPFVKGLRELTRLPIVKDMYFKAFPEAENFRKVFSPSVFDLFNRKTEEKPLYKLQYKPDNLELKNKTSSMNESDFMFKNYLESQTYRENSFNFTVNNLVDSMTESLSNVMASMLDTNKEPANINIQGGGIPSTEDPINSRRMLFRKDFRTGLTGLVGIA
jgi:hypothetical protein